jgi:hypothetical protein
MAFSVRTGIKFGPGEGDYPDTLNVAIVLGLTAVEYANVLIKSPELREAWKKLEQRASEVIPAVPLPKLPNEA